MTICDLKQKEVINIKDCKRLGFVGDVDFDMKTGCMTALIVPGPGCICGFLGREKEYIIPFCDICQVGNDIILVDVKEKNVEEKAGSRFIRKSCMKSLCGLLTLEGSAGAVGGDEPALCKETLTKN